MTGRLPCEPGYYCPAGTQDANDMETNICPAGTYCPQLPILDQNGADTGEIIGKLFKNWRWSKNKII